MLLLAILTKTPKEAPKRPAPIVMVACVGGSEEERRVENTVVENSHDNRPHPSQPHHTCLATVWVVVGWPGIVALTQ
jgi:hypothetical protein